MKKVFILAIATAVITSCNKHSNLSNRVIDSNSSNVVSQYNDAMHYASSEMCNTHEDNEAAYYYNEEEDCVSSSEYNSYTINNCGEADFTITDMNGNYYHVSIDDELDIVMNQLANTAYDLISSFSIRSRNHPASRL